MKIISALMLLFVLSVPGHAQGTQQELESHLLHKPLLLRGLYAGNRLAFDSQGQPLSAYPHAPFTLSGLDIKKVKVRGNMAEIEGERVGLAYEAKSGKFARVGVGEKNLRISVDLAGVTDWDALMDRIFTNSPASFGADLPDYWKAFYHLPLSASSDLQVEKTNDPKSSTFKPNLAAVTPPILRSQPEPEFSEEARRTQFSGICMIKMIVDSSGMPRNLAIEQPVGLGLDEKAVEAVSKYRFTPAMKDGQPVAVALKVEVDFHIYNYK